MKYLLIIMMLAHPSLLNILIANGEVSNLGIYLVKKTL